MDKSTLLYGAGVVQRRMSDKDYEMHSKLRNEQVRSTPVCVIYVAFLSASSLTWSHVSPSSPSERCHPGLGLSEEQ